jgi:hypothetical protein
MNPSFETGEALDIKDIGRIIRLHKEGMSSSGIARKTGVHIWAVELILRLERVESSCDLSNTSLFKELRR